MRSRLVASGLGLLVAVVPVSAAEARTPSKGKAERFLESRFDSRTVDGVRAIGADATCVRPRSTRRSRSTRCVISIVRSDASLCTDNRVIVRYRGKRSNRLTVRGFNPECSELTPPSNITPPALPGAPPATGGSGPTGAPPLPPTMASKSREGEAIARASSDLVGCTGWVIRYASDGLGYWSYHCTWDLDAYAQMQYPGWWFKADVYYWTGVGNNSAYWYSYPVGSNISSDDFR